MLAGRRVLVVADTFLTAELVARILTGWGCTVLGPVARADEAPERIESDLPDVVLLDVDLRGRPGTRLLAALRARGVPFVLVTGHGRTTADVGPPWRDAPRIAKPFDAEQLVRAVAQALRGSR